MLKQNVPGYWFKITVLIMLFSILVVNIPGIFAQVDSTATSITSHSATLPANELNFGKVMLRTLFALFLVILFLVAFLFGLRWLQNQTRASVNRMHAMSVQESITLAPKKQLYLVQMVDRIILIGSSENNISLLLELTDEEKQKLQEKKSSKSQSFSKTLANQIAKIGGAQKS